MGGWEGAIWDDFSSWTCPFPVGDMDRPLSSWDMDWPPGDFRDFEVGGHDGAYKCREHVIVPFIGRLGMRLIYVCCAVKSTLRQYLVNVS